MNGGGVGGHGHSRLEQIRVRLNQDLLQLSRLSAIPDGEADAAFPEAASELHRGKLALRTLAGQRAARAIHSLFTDFPQSRPHLIHRIGR
jgi:hypothetical protein